MGALGAAGALGAPGAAGASSSPFGVREISAGAAGVVAAMASSAAFLEAARSAPHFLHVASVGLLNVSHSRHLTMVTVAAGLKHIVSPYKLIRVASWAGKEMPAHEDRSFTAQARRATSGAFP